MVMEYISGGELFDYILKHGKVRIFLYQKVVLVYHKICFDVHTNLDKDFLKFEIHSMQD